MARLSYRLTDPGPKDIALGPRARRLLLEGVATALEAVAATLGPHGATVLIERPHASPEISRDGYTVVRAIELWDRTADLGARLLREVAHRTNDAVGDGTTTAVVLAGCMIRAGVKVVAAGLDPIGVKSGMDRASAAATAVLAAAARRTESEAELAHVATVSANGDSALGRLLAEAFSAIGAEGFVTIQEGPGRETTLELRHGMQFERGFLSTRFVTDEERQVVELEKPYVLLHEKPIRDFAAIEPALRAFAKSGRCLLVIAEDLAPEALATLVVNKEKGGLKIAAVKAPGFGPRRKALLEDIALFVGAEPITDELGNTLANIKPRVMGTADKVLIGSDWTRIVGGGGERERIDLRCAELRHAIAREKYLAYDRERLQERLARLTSGCAVVRVGGDSEVAIKQRRETVEDAVNTTRAALGEGVLPGGGSALVRAIPALAALVPASA
ncbi:MAG: chaperonin GroEL, partial [Alphaproteobacteria bacterium]|nr:chaperonin GroEL [Alphaproteobacteria bacterium]